MESLLPLAGLKSHQQHLCTSTQWIKREYRWIENIEYQKYHVQWIECRQEKKHRETGEKVNNRFVFLTDLDVNKDNIAAILTAGRARWYIEDHFNISTFRWFDRLTNRKLNDHRLNNHTQKNREGKMHHKYNRNNFNISAGSITMP